MPPRRATQGMHERWDGVGEEPARVEHLQREGRLQRLMHGRDLDARGILLEDSAAGTRWKRK